MKSPVKIFVILAWVIALIGGLWGWGQFVMSDEPMFPSLPGKTLSSEDSVQLSQPQSEQVTVPMPTEQAQPVPPSAPAQTAGVQRPVVNKNDFSCLKSMIWASRRTLDKYVSEKGYPKKQVDIKTQYDKTPAELKRDSFAAGTCHPQYLYCVANSCAYAISFMQTKGRRSTMAATIIGTRYKGQNNGWQTSCIDATVLGKQICLEYGAN